MREIAAPPQLLTVAQAASLLRVSANTIRRWIEADRVPYLRLPTGGCRIPQDALLASLGGNYDLGDELAALDCTNPEVSDADVRRALEQD
jgi:excisionase family DNA binding protein